jgi:predicted membrane protein
MSISGQQLFQLGDISFSGQLFQWDDMSISEQQLSQWDDMSISGQLFQWDDMSINGQLFLIDMSSH